MGSKNTSDSTDIAEIERGVSKSESIEPLEAELPPLNTKNKPTEPGTYWFRSMDIADEWIPVIVFRHEKGMLMVDCPYIGTVQLDYYHDDSIEPEWKPDSP